MEFLQDSVILSAAGDALGLILQPERIMFLWLGVIVGLAIGLLPGVGGLTGFAILVPFTYTMDPYSAFACCLGWRRSRQPRTPFPRCSLVPPRKRQCLTACP